MAHTQAPHVARTFFNDWVGPYGPPSFLLTDNGPQFVAKFFAAICLLLGVKQHTITAYHPQTNGQVERYNKTLVSRLRHYVADHQRNWDEFVQPLTYAYNIQVHKSTGTSPFSLVLSRQPSSLPAVDSTSTAFPTDTDAMRSPETTLDHSQALPGTHRPYGHHSLRGTSPLQARF